MTNLTKPDQVASSLQAPVRRYAFAHSEDGDTELMKHECGGWMKYWDHEKAISEYVRKLDEAVAVIKLIAENGGTTTEEGLHCSGLWCATQARTFLEAANRKDKPRDE